MSRLTRKLRGRKPHGRGLSRASLVLAVCLCPIVAHAAEDSYLEQLNEEVTKVDGNSTDTTDDRAAAADATTMQGGAQRVPSREDFETLLGREHVGTYSFYRRLPERSREEIFVDYEHGASMEALRGKIIDRYLHP